MNGNSVALTGQADDTLQMGHEASFSLEANGEGIELVFGLVGPTGVELGKVYESLKVQLKTVGYEAIVIRLSELISPYLNEGKSVDFDGEGDRIEKLMERGTSLRERTNQKDIVGRRACQKFCV